MGAVYRATDSNLKRWVAIKALPAAVAGDADLLTRFQREAEVLVGLNHPNIAAICGLEKAADFTALVMELVEGEDLSALIDRRYPEAESGSSRLLSDVFPSRSRSPTRSKPRTSRASSIAISSPRTSESAPMAPCAGLRSRQTMDPPAARARTG
jgi:hypothetical protein